MRLTEKKSVSIFVGLMEYISFQITMKSNLVGKAFLLYPIGWKFELLQK